MASIEHLESFVAVAKTGSIVAAAQRLGKTHGPVSLAIQSLETQWGSLFLDGPGKKQLTEKGAAILPWAESVITSYFELKNSVNSAAPQRISLGIDVALPNDWRLEILSSVLEFEIKVEVTTLPSDELISAFNKQRLDWMITLADLPWPETSNFISVGHVDSYLITSAASEQAKDAIPSTFDSGYLLTLPQLSLSHHNRTSPPIYKRFDFPCPWQIRVTDYQQASALLSEVASHTSAVCGNIALNEEMTVMRASHLKATWGVLAFWGSI